MAAEKDLLKDKKVKKNRPAIKRKTKKKDAEKKVFTTEKEVEEKKEEIIVEMAIEETEKPKIVEEKVIEKKSENAKPKQKKKANNYDLIEATEEEIKSVFTKADPDDKNVVAKVENEVINGDPSVLAPKEENESGVKKIIKKINRSIGYFWNGQMIDF